MITNERSKATAHHSIYQINAFLIRTHHPHFAQNQHSFMTYMRKKSANSDHSQNSWVSFSRRNSEEQIIFLDGKQ